MWVFSCASRSLAPSFLPASLLVLPVLAQCPLLGDGLSLPSSFLPQSSELFTEVLPEAHRTLHRAQSLHACYAVPLLSCLLIVFICIYKPSCCLENKVSASR